MKAVQNSSRLISVNDENYHSICKIPVIITSAVLAVLIEAFIREQTVLAWMAQEGNQTLHPGST